MLWMGLMIETLRNTDTALFLFLNGKHNAFFDMLMWWVSYKYTWIPLYALLLVLVWKKVKIKTPLVLLSIALLILISDQISVHFFKNFFERYRPCHNLLIKDKVHLVDGCGGMYGFVSSHAANTFALAVFLSLLFKNNWFTVFLLFGAGLTSYSRIYLGVHYPLDILFGAILGCVAGVTIFMLFDWFSGKIYLQRNNGYTK